MSESNREHLSCLMDGELDRSARQFLLRRISGDSEMKATWSRFHTIRACLHRELASARDLTDRVATALDNEPLPGSNGRMATWFKPVAGAAIAASVALVAIVGINANLLEHQPEPADQPGFVSQPSSLDQPLATAVPVSYSEDRSAERQRINAHVLRHHQASGGAGFIAYVPIVTGIQAGSNVELQTEPATGQAETEQAEN